jgi:molecular chaperone HscB
MTYPVACAACGAIVREPPGLDAFAFFGLERRIDLDATALEKAFLELSRLLHPDKQIARKSPEPLATRQSRALTLAATMNAYYALLRDFGKRAEHLLKALGGPAADKDRRTPPDFLPEMLEAREEVEDAKAAQDRPKLEARLHAFEDRHARTQTRIAALLSGSPGLDKLVEARVELNAHKYLVNLLEELRGALRT